MEQQYDVPGVCARCAGFVLSCLPPYQQVNEKEDQKVQNDYKTTTASGSRRRQSVLSDLQQQQTTTSHHQQLRQQQNPERSRVVAPLSLWAVLGCADLSNVLWSIECCIS
jgi:hypothetical protein